VSAPAGRLVLVGTPIGNLQDLSPRAVAALAAADVIFCEDTRQTRKLLTATGIAAPRLLAMHQHNEAAAAQEAVRLASRGATVAVVTDAGMPAISDPGERVVGAAHAARIPVEVVPGPSAALAALVASGLPAARFCFEGFLPRKGRDRSLRLGEIASRECTSVLFEAPHRVARTLADLLSVCGPQRQVAVGRELTKQHEEVRTGTLGSVVAGLDASAPRGEWVLVVGPAPSGREPATEADVVGALRRRLATSSDRRQAVAEVARDLGLPKREVYRLALSLNDPAT
jgi:16S rRNA (cytidine1402-2'-O)-methyltransferase